MVSMGDGGVACVVASQNFMEHFNSSEPFCGNHGFEKNKNSAKLPDDDQQVADNLQRNKGEWSSRAEFQCENANNNDDIGTSMAEIHVSECGNGNSTDVIAAKTTSTSYSDGGMAAAEPVDRPRRSSRWDVTEESNGWDSRIRENGSGVGLRRHDAGERHKEVELGLGQDNAGREHIGNHQAEKVLGVDGRLKRRGIVSDDVHSRLGHFESPSCRNSNERYSNDRYPGYYKSNSSSRGPYERHSRHFEPSSSSRHGHERYSSRRSGSADRGGYCERSSYENRRCQYEDRNGYKKNSAEKYYGRYSSSQAYDDRKYHRKEVDWRESRRHSNHRQSQSGWDRLVDDSRQSDGRQPHSGWGDRIMDDNRQSDGRQSHSVWGDRILDDNRQSESRQSHSGWGSQVLDDGKGRISSSWVNHGRSSYSSLTKDSRSSKDVEAQLSASPAQTPASDRSERFHDEVRSEGNSAHLSEQYVLSEPPKHEEPICSGWAYIDHLGIEQGPLKLVELRTLVEDGQLQSDHLIKREGSDKWVTIENAASPMPFGKLSLLTSKFLPQAQNDPVSDTPTNKPGVVANSLKIIHEMPNCDSTLSVLQDNPSNVLEDLHIDERVEKLMQGFPLIPGRENEIVSEALRHAARHVNHSLEHYAECEGSPGLRDGYDIYCNRWRDAELGRGFENESNVSKIAITSGGAVKKDLDYDKGVSTGTGILFRGEGYSQFSGRWPSKGGDWKRIGENVGGGDRFLRKKVVLNDGVPLCEILKSGVVDPRKSLQEASCYATHCKRLELPPWAYHWQEEKTDPLHKIDNALEVHLQSGHGSIATPKAHASTSKFQVCTPGSQISTPRGTVVSHGHDGLKTTRTNNGELSKSLIGNKSNQHVSSAAKVSNIGKAASSFQCEMKSVVKSNAAVFKNSVPLCANSQYLEQSTVKVEQVPDQPLRQDLPAEAVKVSPSRIHVSNLPQVTEAEAARPNEVVSSVHVRTVNDLKLDMGEWYFRDGAGHEKGPLTFTQLQMLVSGGTLQKNSSVYRKSDNTWVPIYHQVSATLNSSEKALIEDSPCRPPGTASPAYKDPEQHELENYTPNQAAFHALYPHFVGYARGKLHEHVMKSYRSRDFAAAIGEVLDAWLNPKQSKNSKDTRLPSHLISRPSSLIDSAGNKDNGVNLQNSEGKLDGNLKSSTTCQRSSNHNFSCSGLSVSESEKGSTLSRFESELADSHSHGKNQDTSKRHRLQVIQDVDKRDIARSELQADFYIDRSCGDLVQEATSHLEENSNTQTKMHGSMLNPRILERVFHFLGDDLKSIASSAATCKCWNSVIRLLKSKSRRLDFSSLGPVCNDAVFQSIMGGYGEGKIKHLVLKGCTNLSADALMHFLRGCSSIVSIDIAGCNQFKDVARMFCKVKWQRSRIPGPTSSGDQSEETHYKVKSLKQINDKIYGSCRSSRALDIYTSDDSAGRDMLMPPHEADQGEPMDVDDFHVDSKVTGSPVRQRAYLAKRLKLNSSGKSAKIQMEDGSLKGESSGKSSTGYCAGGDKIIERHLSATLKDILNVNTNNFFLHRASEIEQKIKAGSYTGDMQGINSFGNDLFLICRKAFQEHKKGSRGHITAEEIFKVAHRHFKNLKDKFEKVFSGDLNHQKSAHANDMIPRPGKDKSQSLYATSSNIKKRYRRGMAVAVKRNKRRRGMSNSDCSDFIEEDMSDRERRLLKQKKRHWSDSETETSESSSFLEEEFQEKDDKNDMDNSDLDMKFDSEGEDGACYEQKYAMEEELEISVREWGARMTTESLVPPVTRKYEVIDEYVIVADEAEVSRKMKVCLPIDYEEKLRAAKDKRDNNYAHLEIPELKDYRPRKQLGDEVLEQEVYGIDPYTHNLIFDTMPKGLDFSLEERHAIIEEVLLRVLNESVRDYTGTGKTPMEYPLQDVVQRMMVNAEKSGDICKQTFFQGLLKTMQSRQSTEKYVAYRKGLGVVCNKEDGFEKDDFVVEFLGEVYPAWRWYEKQDGIRSFQKKDKDPAPEFYNIALERPKSDGAGYDLVVVDAMHKANYASRICHSCRPNCEAKVTAVDGQYQIGLYTLRPIQYGEEITFDYNSLTESKEEYEASVCLCGTSCCRGSYLNLAGAGAYQKVLKECHSLLNRHHLLLEACTTNSVTQKDWSDLRAAGVWTCLLSGLPAWAIAYAAHVVRFMNLERSRLPDQILKHIRKEKRKAGIEISYECDERGEAEVQADGFYNQRLHNLAITLDKARYIITKLHKDPTKAPPPLRKIEATELVSLLWKDEDSLVEELLRCMTNHVERERLNHLKEQVHMRELSGSRNLEKSLRESLLWLRDELRNMPSICRCGHDAAADLIHLYAYTKCFFKSLDYGPLESPPLCISPLDLGPKYADSLGAGFKEWQKTYGKDYALGQLIYWFKQTAPDPGANLNKARRGVLVLPDISSCYAKAHRQDVSRGYGLKEHTELIRRMEREPQKPWPKGEFWEFKNNRGLYGSPMFDAVMNNSPLDKEMMQWLRNQHVLFEGPLYH